MVRIKEMKVRILWVADAVAAPHSQARKPSITNLFRQK